MQKANMTIAAFETIHIEVLADVGGGEGGNGWTDLGNLGKAAVNGGVNVLNFFHEHPISLGSLGTYGVEGSRINKPFTNDPWHEIGLRRVTGTAHPAP
jgi:hypothetical protein